MTSENLISFDFLQHSVAQYSTEQLRILILWTQTYSHSRVHVHIDIYFAMNNEVF